MSFNYEQSARDCLRALVACTLVFGPMEGTFAQQLEIHYINVGQGGSTLIIGPDGTTILYDFGNIAGNERIVPYLNALTHFQGRRDIDYAMISHADRDHFKGYRDIVDAGFQFNVANFEPGTSKHGGLFKSFALDPAETTVAGPFRPVPVGFMIALGNDARALVVAANGKVWEEPEIGSSRPARLNENDRSIALFIEYGDFQFLIDGDLGSGQETCTNHKTTQRAIQPRVARALLAQGLITEADGVDVLHIAHHGSESSTSSEYYRLMRPEVGIISVGPKQGTFRHPRTSVVEGVLTCATGGRFSPEACTNPGPDTRAECVRDVPPLKGLFQTDFGNDVGCDTGDPHCVSNQGMVGGNIVITTDGESGYVVSFDGQLMEADRPPNVDVPGSIPFKLDEAT